MSRAQTLLVVSDIHYAGPAERLRRDFESRVIRNPFTRLLSRLYRRHIWLADPLAHYSKLDQLLREPVQPDFTIALGDYSCDSAFVGVSDEAAFESARECLAKLRKRFEPDFVACMGDHELGKFSLFGQAGGLRLASYKRAVNELGIAPLWHRRMGRYFLLGVASSLIAYPVFERESLPDERPDWWKLRAEHLEQIRKVFDGLDSRQKVLLFCHDPTALPFLAREEAISRRLGQIEKTFIGHLHTRQVMRLAQKLSGMPVIRCLGNSVRRMSSGLREARYWEQFNLSLCPSPTGIQLLKDGGYLTVVVDGEGADSIQINFHPLAWQ